jgi:glycosyltransferase involved in cell wall biosynthesis
MVESQALFLPVPTGFYARASLPGKLFEYMGSGKPIIAVAPQDSEVTRVLVDVGGACVLSPGDIDGIAKLLAALCDGHPMASFAPRKPEQLEAYTRAATTRQLAGVFDEVFARKKRGAVA